MSRELSLTVIASSSFQHPDQLLEQVPRPSGINADQGESSAGQAERQLFPLGEGLAALARAIVRGIVRAFRVVS
jgi:hypothetical protein